MIGTDQKRILQ